MSIGTELEHFMEYVFGFCAALDEARLAGRDVLPRPPFGVRPSCKKLLAALPKRYGSRLAGF